MTEKIRYDLIPILGEREVNKILTSKLEEHTINEWRNGLKWSDAISILKKHLSEFELGNDYDDKGLLHIAHVASQALLIAEMYFCYPQGDDRVLGAVDHPIIGLDLDDTVFSFLESYQKRFGVELSDYWSADYNMGKNLEMLKPVEWTMEAIQKNNLPKAKVITLPWNTSKIKTLKELGITVFCDDKYQTFKECLNSGIFCYLMDAPHNKHYSVGHHRITSLEPLRNLK